VQRIQGSESENCSSGLGFAIDFALQQNLIIEGQVLSCACVSNHKHSKSQLWL